MDWISQPGRWRDLWCHTVCVVTCSHHRESHTHHAYFLAPYHPHSIALMLSSSIRAMQLWILTTLQHRQYELGLMIWVSNTIWSGSHRNSNVNNPTMPCPMCLINTVGQAWLVCITMIGQTLCRFLFFCKTHPVHHNTSYRHHDALCETCISAGHGCTSCEPCWSQCSYMCAVTANKH